MTAPASRDTTSIPIELVTATTQVRRFTQENVADLATSIEENGLLHPIVVRPVDDSYVVVAGERRLHAVRSLGWTEVPATIVDVSADEAVWLQVSENMSRSDLSPIEEAEALAALAATGASHTDIARRLGVSKSVVTQRLRLLSLPEAVAIIVHGGALTEGHARQLLRLRAALDGGVDLPVDVPPDVFDRWMADDDLLASLPLALRPLDGAMYAFYLSSDVPHRPVLLAAARSWVRAVSRDTEPRPSWERVALYYAVEAVAGGYSVAELGEEIDFHVEVVGTALLAVGTDDELCRDRSPAWFGYRADLRHNGLGHLAGDPSAALAAFRRSPFCQVLTRWYEGSAPDDRYLFLPPSEMMTEVLRVQAGQVLS